MKRILFVTRDISFVGGTEVFIKNVLLELARRKKYKLYLLEIEGSGKFSNKAIYGLLRKASVKLIKISKDKEDIASPLKVKAFGQFVKKYKIDIVHSFLFNADFLCYLARLGSKESLKTLSKIKSFRSFCNIVPSTKRFGEVNFRSVQFRWVSSKTIDVSIALEKDTPEWIERKRIIDNELEPIVSRYCDIVLPVYKKGLQKWRNFTRKASLLPCTSINQADIKILAEVSLKREKLRKTYNVNPNVRMFVSIGRLAPEKGFENLILFFKSNSASKEELFIAGAGPMEKKLKRLAKGAGNIHFLGHLERNKIFDLLIADDVFVLLSSSEGFPLAIQEAMAAGKPILATNIGGNSDLVSKKNGFLCKNDDPATVVKSFKHIRTLSNSMLIKKGERSREKILHFYMLEKICDDLEKIYSKL